MSHSIVQVDSFTDQPFGGNPAAVCVMSGPADESWMARVAAEMNLSETAFLYRDGDAYHLRWFTPKVEVNLCGHATLATAHVLFEDGHVDGSSAIRFRTRSGELTAKRNGEWIELDFPAGPETTKVVPPDNLLRALGGSPSFIGRAGDSYLLEFRTAADVRTLQPDFNLLGTLDIHGIIVTARGEDGDADFVSRFFAPSLGIPEDPVTGYAHTILCPYWVQKLGKDQLTGYQASERGGYVRVRLEGDRVYLGGRAVTVMRGELI
jgi:PhzF family phenazine biosynthesis protein